MIVPPVPAPRMTRLRIVFSLTSILESDILINIIGSLTVIKASFFLIINRRKGRTRAGRARVFAGVRVELTGSRPGVYPCRLRKGGLTMIIVESYAIAVAMCFVTMLAGLLGQHQSCLQGMALPAFYWDYSSRSASGDRPGVHDGSIGRRAGAFSRTCGRPAAPRSAGLLGGVVFNLANILLSRPSTSPEWPWPSRGHRLALVIG